MYPRRHAVSISVTTGGDGTGYTPVEHGRLLSVQCASTTLGTTGSIVYSNESTLETFLTIAPAATKLVKYPRPLCITSTGGAIKPSTGSALPDYFYLANERVLVTLTNCGTGTAKTVSFNVTIG